MIDKTLMESLSEQSAADDDVLTAEEYLREGPLDALRQRARARKDPPSPMSHCVVAVNKKGKDSDASHAICTSMMNKTGYSKSAVNPRKLTPKGKQAVKRHSAESEHPSKLAAYRTLARKQEQ